MSKFLCSTLREEKEEEKEEDENWRSFLCDDGGDSLEKLDFEVYVCSDLGSEGRGGGGGGEGGGAGGERVKGAGGAG